MIVKRILLKNIFIIIAITMIAYPSWGQELEQNNSVEKPTPEELKSEHNKEEAGRERIEAEADKDVAKALQAFKENRYQESVDLYNEAVKKLRNVSDYSAYSKNKIENIKYNLALVYHYWARDVAEQAEKFYEQEKFDDAIKKAQEAMKLDPSLKSRMARLIQRFQDQKKVAVYKEQIDEEVVDPGKEKRIYEIDILMAQGRELYKQKLWHRAREKFEEILIKDPYNIPAVSMIKKLTKKMYEAGSQRYDMTLEERTAETTWTGVVPLIPRSSDNAPRKFAPIERQREGNRIKQKMEEIIIEHMEFNEATIPAVIKAIRFAAKQQDKDEEGVNIILRMATPKKPSGGTSDADAGLDMELGEDDLLLDDEFGEENAVTPDNEGAGGASGERTITIMFDDLSLGEAIRNICFAAELKYRVEEHAIVIAGKDVPLDEFETRIYPIDSEADFGGVDAGGGDGATSVKQYFSRRGADFPAGSEIVYDNAISRLIATNTPAQLRRIEKIINELNVVDPQVLIECKFVEFQENKHNEFGIGWTFSREHNSQYNAFTNPTDRPRNRIFQANDQPLRFLNTGTGDGFPLNTDDQMFSIGKTTEKGFSFEAAIHAMDLENNLNILSCPRITTQNGEEAIIRMTEEIYFPDSWGEPTILDSGIAPPEDPGVENFAATGYVASMPEFSEPTELGIRLTVTPTVDPDKYTITLDMIPVVQQHVGWTDYTYDVVTGQGTVKNITKMAIIEARTVTTQVTIYDGETIVMGGIMRDKIDTVDDKWPILGDLPIVGRLFRSKYETSRKENLLIFTTPRLVNPNGTPLRQREIRGMPPFRM